MAAEPNHVIGKEASRFYDYLRKGVPAYLLPETSYEPRMF